MKKVLLIILVIGIGTSLWYLFVRAYDLRVTFKVQTLPGVVNQTIKKWALVNTKSDIVNIDDNRFLQKVDGSDADFDIEWQINYENDSTSRVDAHFNFSGSSALNRMEMAFSDSKLEKKAKDLVLEAYELLKDHLDNIRVKVEGEASLKSSFCACINEQTTQLNKAMGMMRNYSYLSSFVGSNELTPKGPPVVEILKWDQKHDSLDFNFCFPIVRQDSLPSDNLVFFKEIKPRTALKAVYNGNYITSDRAWYALLYHAEKNSYLIDNEPVEIFYNNPNFGGNELNWRAEIYLPIRINR